MLEFILLMIAIVVILYLLLRPSEPSIRKVSRAVFVVNAEEAAGNFVITNRTPDAGKKIDIAYMTDEQFNKTFVYFCGMMCVNDLKPVGKREDIKCDVARKMGEPWKIIFAENLSEGDVIQIAMF